MIQRFPLLSVLLLLVVTSQLPGSCDAFLVSTAEDQDIEVIANPHQQANDNGGGTCFAGSTRAGTGMMLDKLLEPYQLIVTPMITQPDSLQEMSYAKILTVPVPVYKMKQPTRISAAELEFQMVLVKGLGGGAPASRRIQEVPYPMEQAMDSWFLGYYWTPLVMSCDGGDDDDDGEHWQHVGWKFTAVPQNLVADDPNNDNNKKKKGKLPHFYALMVQMDETKSREDVRVGGFKAPGWMVGAVLRSA